MPDQDQLGEIRSLAALEALFPAPNKPSLLKEVDHLPPVYQAVIRASPFCILATAGPDGLDASPRGDQPGFVSVHDARTLRLPDRRGNNRVDSLRNIVHDPRVALLFLVPGCGETLRVNGRARILTGQAVLEPFAVAGQLPKCVIEIAVDTAYFQCARAIHRSRLWEPLPAELLATVPTPGQMLAGIAHGDFDAATYDAELPARQRVTLY